MRTRIRSIFRRAAAVCAAVPVLAAVSLLPAAPAHGFGLRDAAAGRNAAAEERARDGETSLARQKLDWEIDKAAGKLADKAADRIERAALRGGSKAWDRLEKTRTFGPAARKIARRYGAAVARGIAVTPKVRAVMGVWDASTAVGGELAPLAVAAIDRLYEGRWAEDAERLARETAELKRRGERRREHKEDLSNVLAVGQAMRRLREEREGAKTAADPWSGAAAKSGAGNDPWSGAGAAWPAARPAAAADGGGGEVSNYEAALKGLRDGGARPADYRQALDKLEADRRAERARKKAEAEAARRREVARAAEERRLRAARAAQERRERTEREETARREAEARERERREVFERAARERREVSRRMYEQSVRQLNQGIQMLQQTRRQQQRAYERERAADLQRQRLRQRERERQRELQRREEERQRRQALERQRREAAERQRQRYEEQRQQVQCRPKRICISQGNCFLQVCTQINGRCVCS